LELRWPAQRDTALDRHKKPLELSGSAIQSAVDASLCRRTSGFAFTQEIEE